MLLVQYRSNATLHTLEIFPSHERVSSRLTSLCMYIDGSTEATTLSCATV